jgi:hypothetical protein
VWEKVSIFTRIEKRYVINIEHLSYDDSKRFLQDRLFLVEFRTEESSSIKIEFNDDAIRKIWGTNNGNPRKMLRQAGTAFSKAIRIGVSKIDASIIL